MVRGSRGFSSEGIVGSSPGRSGVEEAEEKRKEENCFLETKGEPRKGRFRPRFECSRREADDLSSRSIERKVRSN